MSIDHTHDSALTSWLPSANEPNADFPIQNLPYCVFANPTQATAIGVGIGDQIFSLPAASKLGLLPDAASPAINQPTLNQVMSLPAADRKALRHRISELLAASTTADQADLESCLIAQDSVELLLPCEVRDYSDFYASVFHATNVGSMFRPDNPLLPNYKHIPIGYHGRSSSIIASGHDIVRPVGQLAPEQPGGHPSRGPSSRLDYELEIGFLVAGGNEIGSTIDIAAAEEHLFGLTLLNDWSARDLQKWEYQPLGPFLAKSFASTISPWVITMEALAPFRCPEFKRADGDPTPLDYLVSQSNSLLGGVDVNVQAFLETAKMKQQSIEPIKLSQSNLKNMYWTPAQILTHHASNGCNLQSGDMLGSGTISGPERDSRGCLLELTWDGDANNPLPGTQRTPIQLPTGEERTFLLDGDTVILTGYCEKDGFAKIGLGQCSGTVMPVRS